MLAWWSRRFLRWLVALVVLPLAARALVWIADQLAQKHGESRFTALLRLPHGFRSAHAGAR
jgi:hypothetical protein